MCHSGTTAAEHWAGEWWQAMKTYVAEIDGEAILVFRAADDEAAQNILCEEDGGFQLVARGYSGLLRADGRPLLDGRSPIRHRAASPEELGQWLIVRDSRTESTDDPDDWVVYLVPVVSIDDAGGDGKDW